MLTGLVDATLSDDGGRLQAARAAVRAAAGDAGLVDAAAVMATFQRMTRFADATGIALDATIEMASRTLRAEIGLDRFATARNTPAPGVAQRLGAQVAERVVPQALRLMARLQRRLARARRW